MAEEDEVRITLRLPEDLRDRLKKATEESGRSMNAEIVDRLTKSFDIAYAGDPVQLEARFTEIASFVVDLAEQLKAAASREGELQGRIMALAEALEQSTAQNERLLVHFEKGSHVSS
jgi:predicted butyrate kinase (DUF1464 family)